MTLFLSRAIQGQRSTIHLKMGMSWTNIKFYSVNYKNPLTQNWQAMAAMPILIQYNTIQYNTIQYNCIVGCLLGKFYYENFTFFRGK